MHHRALPPARDVGREQIAVHDPPRPERHDRRGEVRRVRHALAGSRTGGGAGAGAGCGCFAGALSGSTITVFDGPRRLMDAPYRDARPTPPRRRPAAARTATPATPSATGSSRAP